MLRRAVARLALSSGCHFVLKHRIALYSHLFRQQSSPCFWPPLHRPTSEGFSQIVPCTVPVLGRPLGPHLPHGAGSGAMPAPGSPQHCLRFAGSESITPRTRIGAGCLRRHSPAHISSRAATTRRMLGPFKKKIVKTEDVRTRNAVGRVMNGSQ